MSMQMRFKEGQIIGNFVSMSSSSPMSLTCFDPQGSNLCCVSVELDKQRVFVVETEHAAARDVQGLLLGQSSLRVCALEFTEIGDVQCVLLALNSGEIWVYAPAANQVMAKMTTGCSFEIRDITVGTSNICWCIDADDNIYRFDLAGFTLQEHFKIEGCNQLNRVCVLGSEHLLLASHSVALVDLTQKTIVRRFPGHVSPILHLQALTSQFFLTGALNDRFLNVYDVETGATRSVLVLQSNVREVAHQGDSCVVATTEDGEVELFEDPLVPIKGNKRRTHRSKQCTKRIHAQRPLINVHVSDVVEVIWLENVTWPRFSKLPWRQLPADYELAIPDTIQASANKNTQLHPSEAAAPANYKEGNAGVTSGDNFRHVSDAIRDWENELAQLERLNEEPAVESLADRLGQRPTGKRKTFTTPGTVSVILSQALQANDNSLLETALNNRDDRMIRDTVARLRPPLAVLLLERLAERIARQSHRQGQLNVWVKWCLIIHGGYLVNIPNLMSSLSSLHSTLKRRSDLLPRLLVLETRIESTLNTLHQDNELQPEESDDEDVEYNEELDDYLIEDGEAGESDEELEDEIDEEIDELVPDGLSQEEPVGDSSD